MNESMTVNRMNCYADGEMINGKGQCQSIIHRRKVYTGYRR